MPFAIATRGDEIFTSSPSDEDAPTVRRIHAVEHAHHRGLAGAVLADERMDLTGAQVEPHVVVRDDAGEPLRDALRRRAGRFRAPLRRVPADRPRVPATDFGGVVGTLIVPSMIFCCAASIASPCPTSAARVAVGVADAVVGQVEDLCAVLKAAFADRLDRVVRGGVDPLERRGDDLGLLGGARGQLLVRVDADRVLRLLGRRLEQARAREPGGVVDHVRARLVHLQRQRVAGRGVVERR